MARFGMVPADSARVELEHLGSIAPRTRISKPYGWARDVDCRYDNQLSIVELLITERRYWEAGKRLRAALAGDERVQRRRGRREIMERARVFERLGNQELARESYAFVADAWRTADGELQRYVRESHSALVRLGASRAGSIDRAGS